jgi:hypothetical protein
LVCNRLPDYRREDALECGGGMNWKEEGQTKMTDEQRKMLTVDILREILDYDPDSGKFIWKVKMSTKAMPGYIAGCKRKNNGYRVLRIFGVNYH